jgi:hypothetical protein
VEIGYNRAAHILLTHFSKIEPRCGGQEPDGRFDQQDLLALSHRQDCPTDVKAAAEFFQDQEQFARLDTAAGILPADSYAGRLDLVAGATEQMESHEALNILCNYADFLIPAGPSNPTLDRSGLNSILHHPETTPDLREAAYFYLSRPEEFQRLDTAAGLGLPADGRIGRQDLHAANRDAHFGLSYY